MLDDIRASLDRAGVPFNDKDIEHFVLFGYDKITTEYVLLSIIRLYKSGQVDAGCISAILNGLNTTDSKSAKPFNQEWQLNAHYGYHHQKFGNITLQEYQQRAKDFMSNIPGAGVVQLIRSDSQYVRWNTITGEFAIVFPDRSIKTYFSGRLSGQRMGLLSQTGLSAELTGDNYVWRKINHTRERDYSSPACRAWHL